MHIVVTLKQVHDPNTPPVLLKIGIDGKSLELPAGMTPILNGYDVNAVEEAIKIKEKLGGTVTVLSVGDESMKTHLRRAIAMGADSAVLVAGPTGLVGDSHVVATFLAAAIKKLPPTDLVLCGRQSSDTDAGQVPFILAEKLGIPTLSPIRHIPEIALASITVDRLADEGTQRVRAILPVLLGISGEINKPRAASLKGVMQSKKAEIPTWSQRDLNIEVLTPALTLRRLYIENETVAPAEIITAASVREAGRALADRLHQEGML
jgi:electron transfer flavoprotein beta subunit